MIRSDKRLGPALVVVLAGSMVWGTGCKKEEAASPVDAGVVAVAAVHDAGVPDAGTVAQVKKPLRFSDVTLTKTDDRLTVTYTLTNPGTAQARGDACLSLHDEQGMFIDYERLGGITVKGGTSDTFEDQVRLTEAYWKQARTVLLFTSADGGCPSGITKMTSERFQVLPSGQPAPAGTPAPQAPETSPPVDDLVVSDVQLRQEGISDNYSITYTVKNPSTQRVSGRGCLRGYIATGERFLDEDFVGEFSLRPGGSETLTDTVVFDNDKHWDEVKVLRLYMNHYGCAGVVDAENLGFSFDKPSGIHAPLVGVDAEVEDEPETDMDSSDEYDTSPPPLAEDSDSDSPEETGH
ncbi:MAG: hypothetical protein EOO71_05775 [Myxococcaceae bacterium]|nr:MAG: hypothetical protein EOO71_05775 [Myxococcaceae bacterium]